MEENKQVVKKEKVDVGTQVIERVNALCEAGFTMPHDFNYVNAIKASMLTLQEVVDKNKKPALEVCTPASIQTALFQMCTMGLDVSKKNAYFVVRGNKLCLHVSYFGHILQVKRIYPDWTPIAHTIREGDEFEYSINPETGKIKLVKHIQKLENLDNDFIGAYMYLPCADGSQELYVMTKKQILKAWSKSSSQNLQTHKDFDEKMALKTIINSGCTKVINATPNPVVVPSDDEVEVADPIEGGKEAEPYVEFEEVAEQKAEQTAENNVPHPPAKPTEQPSDDEF